MAEALSRRDILTSFDYMLLHVSSYSIRRGRMRGGRGILGRY